MTDDKDAALRHATRLAQALHDKHYPDNGEWRPLPNILGVIDQIDNMTVDLKATEQG